MLATPAPIAYLCAAFSPSQGLVLIFGLGG